MSNIIYVYSNTSQPGWLKVGQTSTGSAAKRVRNQATGAGAGDLVILWEGVAQYADGQGFFTDKDVHRRLEKAGVGRFCKDNGRFNEWFYTDLPTIQAAFEAQRQRAPMASRYTRHQTFGLRPEQARAVEETCAEFNQAIADGRHGHMLWNAKMRFGKTFTTYQLAKAQGYQRILITTFMPAVGSSWESDLESHVDFEGWRFVRAMDQDLEDVLKNHQGPVVVFSSLQDLMGYDKGQSSEEKKTIKQKNQIIHNTSWDLVVLDEYHHGAWREGAQELFSGEVSVSNMDDDFSEDMLPIQSSRYLYLSGTAFRALESGDFNESQIFQWTYPDEQKAKSAWVESHPSAKATENPYGALPKLHMITLALDEALTRNARDENTNEFDLNTFFEAKFDENGQAFFVREEDVITWLRQITGRRAESRQIGGDKAKWPFAPNSQSVFGALRHTAWYLPGVASCCAMKELLEKDAHFGGGRYSVIVAAGSSAGQGEAALAPVRAAIGSNPYSSQTITLTCGKLMTGVTVPEWTGILMLRNLSTPETYFQAAFRVQSPWVGQQKSEDGVMNPVIRKNHAFVFDFAPNRALRLVSDYATRSSGGKNVEQVAAELVEVLPILAWDGNSMKQLSASDLLDIVTTGTSATLLAKKWESALLVNLDNAVLSKAMQETYVMDAIHSILGHRRLNQSRNDLQMLINAHEEVESLKKKQAAKKASGNDLSSREKSKLSEAEKQKKDKRKEIREKLIKFSTRLPLFMYLSDHREMALDDVIRNIEPGLFKTVTGLSVEQFDVLVSVGLFNKEIMNSAVYNFKRYEDGSLDYVTVEGRHEEIIKIEGDQVGLFSTTMSKSDAKVMYGE